MELSELAQQSIIDSFINSSQFEELAAAVPSEHNSAPCESNATNSRKPRKKYHLTTDQDRETIIKHYLAKKSYKHIAELVGAKYKTVQTIISTYQRTGRVASKVRGSPREPKLSPDQKEFIRYWILEDCSVTLTALKGRVFSEFNISISTTTLNHLLHQFRFSIDDVKRVASQGTKIWQERVDSLPRLH